MKFINLMTICASLIFITACSSASGIGPRPGFGAVIVVDLQNGSSNKDGLEGITDTGRRLFGGGAYKGGSSNGTFVGETAPKTVRISWRKPVPGFIIATTGVRVETLDFGEVLGDYTIEVASRIPAEVMKYASEGKGRAIRLVFRVKDDGVLLAWSVQESYDGFRVYSYWGGDFPCDPVVGDGAGLLCTPGFYKTPSWYRPK